MTEASLIVRLLARLTAPAFREAVVEDVLDDYRAARSAGTGAVRARARFVDACR